MAQAKKITLVLTPKQMENFLDQYFSKVTRKEAKRQLLTFQKSEKSEKPSKPDLKKQNSATDLNKMKAADVEALAKKMAKKNKEEIDCKGKKPTKAENITYMTDGETTDTSKKSKKSKKDKPESKELTKFCDRITNEKKLAKMELSELRTGAKLDGFSKRPVQDVRVVAVAMAKLQKVKIPNKGKTPTKAEYLAFATGKIKGVKDKGKEKEKEKKGNGKDKKKEKEKKGKGKVQRSDPDSEEESPSDTESGSGSSSSGSDSDTFSSCTNISDSGSESDSD